MNSGTDTEDALLRRMLDWAATQDDIQAVLRTGSKARADGRVDALSDDDIELYTTAPERYAGWTDWLGELATVWVSIELDGPYDNPAHLVFFEGGRKFDFQVLPVAMLAEMREDGLDELHERGYQILFDRDGVTADLPAPTGSAPRAELPDQEAFDELCAEFWFEIAHLPRYLAREDLWVVQARGWETKELLLSMIEWHALAHHGAGHDVWHLGSKMRDWAAPGVWSAVTEIFAVAEPLEQARRTADLFATLAREVAGAFDLEYPERTEKSVRPCLDRLPKL